MSALRIGTRGSALALWQSRYVAEHLQRTVPGLATSVVEISSKGDRITDVPLSHVEGTGFFTAAIEQALLAGEVDVAVHSYKDLPIEATPGLTVAAVPVRAAVEDVLCARDGLTLATLPSGARVGTCSARRTAQIVMVRPDVAIVPLRGNVPTRVARVGADLDAIVLARAGLERLGLGGAVSEVFAVERMLPAPAQGALALQCRAGDEFARVCLAALDDSATRKAVAAERTLLHALQGGCSVPVGAVAVASHARIELLAGVFNGDGSAAVRTRVRGASAHDVGMTAARRLLKRGAGEILAEYHRAVAADTLRAAWSVA